MDYFLPRVRQAIAQAAASALSVNNDLIVVEDSPEQFESDLAVPCFALAKELKKSPDEIAKELSDKLKLDEIEKTEAIGGYLNIWLKPSVLAAEFSSVSAKEAGYGTFNAGKGRTVVVDFIGLNLSKPFSVGHLRPSVQGWALIQIYKAMGYQVVGDSHLGDWGTPFGMWVVAYEKWGDEKALASDGVYELGRLYVKFRGEAEQNPELLDEAKAWLKKLEAGDKEAKSYHERFNKISLDHADTVLGRLKIKADENFGESFYVDMAQELTDQLVKEGQAEQQDDGSVIVRLDDVGMETPALLRKGDGSILYLTTDLATIRFRIDKWDPSHIIYSVGGEQQLHFKQVFAVVEKLGWTKDRVLAHPWFGLIEETDESGKRGKMSSRKNIALMENLLDKAEEEARSMVKGEEKLSDNDLSAIAVGAIKFNDFAQPRTRNILFDWESMFSLNGRSAAYIQYAAVRVGSILDKLTEVKAPPASGYDWLAEKELLMQLSRYPETVKAAAAGFEPHKIADYAYNLARAWSRYYETTPVRDSEGEALKARSWLLAQLQQNFEHALGLLGIEVPSKM